MFKYCIMPFFQLIMHNIYDVTFILNQSLSIVILIIEVLFVCILILTLTSLLLV